MIYENYEELIKEHQIVWPSDLFEFCKLYKSLGIDLRIGASEVVEDCGEYVYRIQMVPSGTDMETVGADATENVRFNGYRGCCSTVYFDNDGKFSRQGFFQ